MLEYQTTENCNDFEESVTSNEENVEYSPSEISAASNELKENFNDIEESSYTNIKGNIGYSIECSNIRK